MQRRLIALALASCGPAEPAPVVPVKPAPTVSALPDAGAPLEASAPVPTAPLVFRARELSRKSEPGAARVAWAGSELMTCDESWLYCGNDCFIKRAAVRGGDQLVIEDRATKRGTIPPLPVRASFDQVSASRACDVFSFLAPSSGLPAYEIWDANGKSLGQARAWQVAGGVFDASLTASGKFLRWEYSRGSDRYEEIASHVKGPEIGLSTVMSPDERFVFVGGGMTFGTDQDTPSELLFAKNGKRVYAIDKPPQIRTEGAFCPSGNLLAVADQTKVTLRSTSDAAPLATMATANVGAMVFSPDGAKLATLDDKKVVRVYALERCRSEECAPIDDCR